MRSEGLENIEKLISRGAVYVAPESAAEPISGA